MIVNADFTGPNLASKALSDFVLAHFPWCVVVYGDAEVHKWLRSIGKDGLSVQVSTARIYASLDTSKEYAWTGHAYYFKEEKHAIYFKLLVHEEDEK